MNTDSPSVLIVDDVEANLIALEGLLASLDCQVVRATGGNDALRQLLKREFAVMLLDVQMPEIDGFEVAKHAHDNPSTRDLPIIFLTASHHGEASMLRGYGSGAVDFLLKPFNSHVLRAKVKVFLDLYSSRLRLADEVRAHQQTLAALREANDALRQFTNAASHDLRAPLRAMRGLLDIVSDEAGDTLGEQARDYLNRSRAASQRMDDLLNSLLAYAGLQKKPAFAEVDCNLLIEQVNADLAEPLGKSAATICADDLPTLVGDASRLYQLLQNLVSNAIKFRHRGEPLCIEISAQDQDDAFVFCVKDNGIGVDQKHQVAIFDEFRRLSSTSDGAGLGLTICRKIVEAHGGRLWIESELGRGSSFYFSLLKQPHALAP